MMSSNVPVGIIGGGPVGLMMALLLARQGVRSVVLERKAGLSTHPKAMGVSRRTAEIYRQLGLYEKILAGSLPAEGRDLAIWSTKLIGGEELGRVPLTGENTPFTPVIRAHCPQTWVEQVLYDALLAEPLAELRFDTEASTIEPGAESVTILLKSGEKLAVDWVVAADGAGSAVRRQLGIEGQGPGDMGHFLNIMFRANYGPLLKNRAAMLYQALSPEYFEAFVAVDGKDTWLMHQFLMPGQKPEDFSKESLEETIRYVSGVPDEPVEVLSISPWVMSPRVASQFRSGRVFLVGDAAARLSPTGGLGLNTGLQSAHNLAWKLALVIKGQAGGSLLDTYDEERHDVAFKTMTNTNKNADEIVAIVTKGLEGDMEGARKMIAHSRRAGTGLGQDLGVIYERGALVPDGTTVPAVADPVNDYIPQARPGSRLPHIPLPSRKGASTLDLVGGEFCLLHGAAESAWSAAAVAASISSAAIDEMESDFFQICQIGQDGAVLVRPDGYVAARWPNLPSEPAETLAAALSQILGV